MPPPTDPTSILEEIRRGLYGEGASKLLEEVRDALRAKSEPSVRQSLVQLQQAVVQGFREIHDLIARGGVPGSGLGQHVDQDTENRRFHRDEITELTQLREEIKRLEQIIEISGSGGQAGRDARYGGGGHTAFDYEAMRRRYEATESIVSAFTKNQQDKYNVFYENMFKSQGVIHAQYIARQRDAVLGFTNLLTRTLDVVGAFEKLASFTHRIVTQGYTGYAANRDAGISGAQYMFNDLNRVFEHGFANAGYDPKMILEGVRQAASTGTSPTIMFGQTIDTLSRTLVSLKETLAREGFRVTDTFRPDQLTPLISALMERQKTSAPFQQMDMMENRGMLRSQLDFLAQIAKYTNISADQLIAQAKQTGQEISTLQVLGMVSAKEAPILQGTLTALEKSGPNSKEAADLIKMYLASNREQGLFYQRAREKYGPGVTQDLGRIFDLAAHLSQAATTKTDYPEFHRTIVDAIEKFAASSSRGFTNPTINAAQRVDQSGYAKLLTGLFGLSNEARNPEKPPEPGIVGTTITAIDDLAKQYPIFADAVKGFGNWIVDLGKHVAEFGLAAWTLRRFWQAAAPAVAEGGSGAGGLLAGIAGRGGGGGSGATAAAAEGAAAIETGMAYYWGVVRAAAMKSMKFGAIGGGLVSGVEAYEHGATTGGVVGAGVGGAAGGGVGAAAGALLFGALGSVIPVLGTGIGLAAGAAIGGWLGTKFGGQAGEAVGTKIGTTISGSKPPEQAAAAAGQPPRPDITAAAPPISGLSEMVGAIVNRLDEQMKIQANILTTVNTIGAARTAASQQIDISGMIARLDEQIRLQSGLLTAITGLPAAMPSTNMTPPVPVVQNVVGPQPAPLTAPTGAVADYQDQVLLALSQIIQTGETGNSVLTQVYGELTRQTGLLAAESGDAGMGGYTGIGLSSTTSSVAKTGRPDHSTPYSGPGM